MATHLHLDGIAICPTYRSGTPSHLQLFSLARMAASDQDLRQIWNWNSKIAYTLDEQCVHEVIRETTLRQPQATAVHA